MKALEILKQVSANKIPTFYITQEFVTYANYVNEAITELEARIAELEALQAPKNCDGCKYNRFGSGSDGIAVDCTLVGYGCIRGLWKDYYEPKDSK
jgi:hypothetical protein